MMAESDFVVVACLLNEQTRALINAERLALMKPTAYLINVARGPIVHEPALIEALRARRIAGAALDVFTNEPVENDNPLLAMDNVIVTPHALCWTDECFGNIAREGFWRARFAGARTGAAECRQPRGARAPAGEGLGEGRRAKPPRG